ncbi:MAG: cupin domain-containing protein [Candidatus Latescibacterota bacterium]
MPFIQPDTLPEMELFEGIRGGIAAGERLMLSFLELAAGAEVPEHSHPHEQAGLVLAGRLRFRIGQEERTVGPGDAFIIPPNVAHWGVVEEGPVRVLDLFSPPREDYLERYNRFTGTSGQTRWK